MPIGKRACGYFENWDICVGGQRNDCESAMTNWCPSARAREDGLMKPAKRSQNSRASSPYSPISLHYPSNPRSVTITLTSIFLGASSSKPPKSHAVRWRNARELKEWVCLGFDAPPYSYLSCIGFIGRHNEVLWSKGRGGICCMSWLLMGRHRHRNRRLSSLYKS
jgi:hypothetical protein